MTTSARITRIQVGKALLACALLAAGISIYLLMRSRNLLGFQVIDALGLGDVTDGWRHTAHSWHALPPFVVYCVPGGLWAAAYILIIDSVFQRQSVGWRLSLAAFIPATGIISEAMQAMGWLPGTADALDALCYALPFLLYLLAQLPILSPKTVHYET